MMDNNMEKVLYSDTIYCLSATGCEALPNICYICYMIIFYWMVWAACLSTK